MTNDNANKSKRADLRPSVRATSRTAPTSEQSQYSRTRSTHRHSQRPGKQAGRGNDTQNLQRSSGMRPAQPGYPSRANQRFAATRTRGNSSGQTVLIAIIAIVALASILAIAFTLTRCSATPSAESSRHETAQPSSGTTMEVRDTEGGQEPEPAEMFEPNRDALVDLLGDEEADKLIATAQANSEASWIAAHPEEYEFEGPEVQYKILKLAADEPESISYVREFPEKYPAENQTLDSSVAMNAKSPSSDVPDTSIPHLYQWDRQWAETIYCSTTFGLTGCGPTTLAMIYQGLLGRDDKTPYDLGLMAQERGYMQQFDGTDAGFFTDVAYDLGLSCTVLDPTADNIINELSSGHAIITNLAPGYFTRYGHFFVLAGLADGGKVIINDPYSVVRSGQTWDADFIASESRVMYSYSA